MAADDLTRDAVALLHRTSSLIADLERHPDPTESAAVLLRLRELADDALAEIRARLARTIAAIDGDEPEPTVEIPALPPIVFVRERGES